MNPIRKLVLCVAALIASLTGVAIAPTPAEASPAHSTLGHCFLAHANLKVFYPEAALGAYFRLSNGLDVCIFGHRNGTSVAEINVWSHYIRWSHQRS